MEIALAVSYAFFAECVGVAVVIYPFALFILPCNDMISICIIEIIVVGIFNI